MKWLTQLLNWASMLVLARLLTRADFGIVGVATVFLGLITQLSTLGLGAAIVRERDLSEDQIARLGGASLALGFLLAAASAAAAVPIAGFFRDNAVAGVVAAMGVTFVTTRLQVIPRSLLQRELQFRRVAWIDGLQAVVATISATALALLGFHYWSLVLGNLISAAVATTAFLLLRPHRLAWPRHWHDIQPTFKVGGQIMVAGLAWYGYSNADFVVVGRVLGVETLGTYNLGWAVASAPVDMISVLVGRVVPGVFSAVQHDLAGLRRYVLRLTEGLALITFPASLGMAVVADEFVVVALGEKWRAAVLPLRLLVFYSGVRSITTLLPQVLVAVGHARRSMQFSLLALAVMPPMFYIGSRWGTGGVAAAWIVAYPLVMVPVFRAVFSLIVMPGREYLDAIWPALSTSVLMAAAVLLVRTGLPSVWPLPVRLGVEVGAGVLTYGLLLHVFHRDRMEAALALFREHRP